MCPRGDTNTHGYEHSKRLSTGGLFCPSHWSSLGRSEGSKWLGFSPLELLRYLENQQNVRDLATFEELAISAGEFQGLILTIVAGVPQVSVAYRHL